jgi:Holliday junction resolvase
MSVRKGGAYEREIAKKLSLWLTNGKEKNELIRSVSSGGWKFKQKRQVGDLAPNGPHGAAFRDVFGVECKNRESFLWQHYWTSKDPELFKWWKKIMEESNEANLLPLIIYRKNYVPDVIGSWDRVMRNGVAFTIEDKIEKVATFNVEGEQVLFIKLEDFFSHYDPEVFIQQNRLWLTN